MILPLAQRRVVRLEFAIGEAEATSKKRHDLAAAAEHVEKEGSEIDATTWQRIQPHGLIEAHKWATQQIEARMDIAGAEARKKRPSARPLSPRPVGWRHADRLRAAHRCAGYNVDR